MPTFTPPVSGEHDALATFLGAQLDGVRAATFGLTDDEARAVPLRSELSIGALLKHTTYGVRHWLDRVDVAPERLAADTAPSQEAADEYADQLLMRPDEALGDLVASFDTVRARAVDGIRDGHLDLDLAVPKPSDAPWWPTDVDGWNVRWVILHLIEEAARHAGHADLIREQLDGETMYTLVAGLDGEEPSQWLQPAVPHTGSYDSTR